ncbi:MAG: histidinol-phosphate aminotransferase, partial [Actinomycetota bacterium]
MKRIDPRPQIVAMSNYHSPQVDVPIRLNTNESPFPPPVGWTESLGSIAASIDWNRYPDRGATALRTEIAARHGVAPANVFVGNGSNEVLQLLLLAFGGEGRTVAMFEPTYQMYAQIARVTGASVVTGERRADFTLDPLEI